MTMPPPTVTVLQILGPSGHTESPWTAAVLLKGSPEEFVQVVPRCSLPSKDWEWTFMHGLLAWISSQGLGLLV